MFLRRVLFQPTILCGWRPVLRHLPSAAFSSRTRFRPVIPDDPFPDASDEHRMLLGNAIKSESVEEIKKLADSGVTCAMGYLGVAYRDGQ